MTSSLNASQKLFTALHAMPDDQRDAIVAILHTALASEAMPAAQASWWRSVGLYVDRMGVDVEPVWQASYALEAADVKVISDELRTVASAFEASPLKSFFMAAGFLIGAAKVNAIMRSQSLN